MIVNAEKIRQDIVGGVKTAIFIEEFPNLRAEIIELKGNPNCASCITKTITPMLSDPAVKEKLSLIYGKDIQIDSTKPVPVRWKQTTEVRRVVSDLWPAEFDKLMIPSQDKQFRFMTTHYDSDTKEVVASIMWMEKITD